MLVVETGTRAGAARLLRRGARAGSDPRRARELVPVSVSFGDAIQVFNIGARVGRDLRDAGRHVRGAARFGRMPLAELVAPAAKLARDGVELTARRHT